MRLKNEVEYVFRILLYLSKYGKDRVISSTEISEKEQIPHLSSLRILKKMEKAGLLSIQKGAKGGYSLKKDPKDITLKTAIECIEGDIIVKDCVSDPKSCSLRGGRCSVHRAMALIEKEFIEHLAKYNFQDLSDENYF